MAVLRQPARINIRVVTVLALLTLILGVGTVLGHRYRRSAMADTALAAGTAAWDRRDYEEASRQLRKYLSHAPDDPEALDRYAQANLAIRPVQPEKVGAGIAAYRRLLRQRLDEPRIWKELVKLYSGTGQPGEAAYICRSRLEHNPNDEEATYHLGKVLLAQRKPAEAAEVLTKLVHTPGETEAQRRLRVQACGMLSACATQGGSEPNNEKAMAWLDRAVEKFPDSAEAYAQRARFFRTARNDSVAAQRDLEAAQTLAIPDPGVRLLIIDEWLHWNQPDRARAGLRSLELVTPSDLEEFNIDSEAWTFAHYSAACRLALRQNDPELGPAMVERALGELHDFRRLAFLPLAVDVYLNAGRIEAARPLVGQYRESLRERRDVTEQMREQAVLMAARLAEAEGDFVSVINVLDDQSSAVLPAAGWKLLWRAYEKTGQARASQRALRELVARADNDAEAIKALADVDRDHNWREVLRLTGRAEQLAPHDLEVKLLRLEAQLQLTPAGESGRMKLQDIAGELARLFHSHPERGPIRVLQAGVEHRLGNTAAALALLRHALANCERHLAVDLALVSLFDVLGSQASAVDACRQAIERHPRLAAPRLRLAELQAAGNQEAQVGQTLTEAASTLEGVERIRVILALARHRLGRNQGDEGLRLLTELARDFPNDARPRIALLELPELRARPPETQKWIDELKRIEGQERGVFWRLAQARLWLGSKLLDPAKRHAADDLLQSCIRNDSTWAAPVVALGRSYEQTGKYEAAEALYRRHLDSSGIHLEIAHRLLYLYERQHRFSDADSFLQRLPPDAPLVSRHRLMLALGQGDYAAALPEIDKRLTENPQDVSLLIIKAGLVYAQNKDLEAALAILDEAHRLEPDLMEVTSARASILHAAGRQEEAVKLLDNEVARRNEPAAYVLRGKYRAAIGRPEEAERDFANVLSIDESHVDAVVALARLYLDQGKTARAIEIHDRALRRNPAHFELRRTLVDALSSSANPQDHQRARRTLEDLQTERPDDARLLLQTADLTLLARTPQADREAAEWLERAVGLDPRLVPAHVRLIELAQQRGDRRAVEDLVNRATGANPDDPDLRLVRAGVERELGNLQTARELAQSVLEDARRPKALSAPRDGTSARRVLGAATLLADLAVQIGDLMAAEQFAQEALRADPEGELAQLSHARVQAALGHVDEAISTLEAFRRSAPGHESAATRLALADLYLRRKNFSTAEALLTEAKNIAGGVPAVQLAEFRLWAAQCRFDEIAERLESASSPFQREGEGPTQRLPTPNLASTEPDSKVLLLGAKLLSESSSQRYLPKARQVCERVLSQQPACIEAHLTLARAAHRQRDLATCEQSYRKVLEIEPYHAEALNDLAWILAVDQNKPADGLSLADKGILRYPDDYHLLDTRGVILFQLGRFEDARRDLERCLLLPAQPPPSRALTLLHLGRILLKQNDFAKARSTFQEALTLDGPYAAFSEAEKAEIRLVLDAERK